jgi:hypothetical protein
VFVLNQVFIEPVPTHFWFAPCLLGGLWSLGDELRGRHFGAPPNFAKLAEAVNGYGEQVTELSQLALALKCGLEHTRTTFRPSLPCRYPDPCRASAVGSCNTLLRALSTRRGQGRLARGVKHLQRAIVVKGRLINPRMIELDEPVSELTGDVEVILRAVTGDQTLKGETVFEFLRRLPVGARTKEDIDRQIGEERDSWGTH